MSFRSFFRKYTSNFLLFKKYNLSKYIQLEDWQIVKAICENYPEKASKWTTRASFFSGTHKSRVLPIHEAFATRAPPDVIEALLLAFPKGIMFRESCYGLTPLHIACKFNAPIDSIRVALKYNACAGIRDCHGRAPIHYVCSNNCDVDKLQLLLEVYPNAVYFTDNHGCLPIHKACRYGADFEAIQLLVNFFPESVRARTIRGSTPFKLVLGVNCKNKERTLRLLEDDGMLTKYFINRDPDFALYMPKNDPSSFFYQQDILIPI